MSAPKPIASGVLGLTLGALALVTLTAVGTAAIASASADDKLDAALSKIERLNDDQAETQAKQDTLQHQLDARAKDTMKARRAAVERDAELRRRIYTLTVFLRQHGFAVPAAPKPAPSTKPAQPKAAPTPAPAPQPGNSGDHRKKPKKH